MAEDSRKRSRRKADEPNLDVEEAVLGALLIEPNCIDEAMDELTPGCFYSEKHRMIFEAMRSLSNEHVALDILSVSQKLKAQGNLEVENMLRPERW